MTRRSSRNQDRISARWAALRGRVRSVGALRLVAAIVVLGGSALFFGGAGAAIAAWTQACAGGCPTASEVQYFSPQQASEVYDAEGGLLALFYRERRQLISLSDLPPQVPLAFVAIEDRRFFEHNGVDIRRILGAVRDNLLHGFAASGASTISMQVARNLFPEQLPRGEMTLRRKVAEARLALAMEKQISKQEILELYLNNIFFGAGAYGIEAAARTYFGKPAAELTLVEAATLAGLPQAPSSYNPREYPEAAVGRRNVVLNAMASTGVITQEEADEAKAMPLDLAPPGGVSRAPYFVEEIRRRLETRFGELLYTGGLKIYTTLDPALQHEAETALEDQLESIESGAYGYYGHPTYDEFVKKVAESGDAAVASTPYLQGTVVTIDPHTGDVLALVGGRNYSHSQFNRATQALRQPGSSFKPFVYGAALEQGKSPLYKLVDSPLVLTMPDGQIWEPQNYEGTYDGEMTLRDGLKESKNIIAIRLGQEIGTEAVRDFARRAGIDTPIPDFPSIFIGAAAVYPLDLVTAYAAFDNNGMRVEPRFIEHIDDANGQLIWKPRAIQSIAFAPSVAWILTDMLRDVIDSGTGYNVRNPAVGNLSYDIPAAGKTGTTNDNTNVWFVGYTPDILTGVWIGFDQPQTISGGATGGVYALPIWARVVRSFYDDREPPPEWVQPPDVEVRHISRWTGTAVPEDCLYAVGSVLDYFVAEAEPPEPVCEPPKLRGDPLPGRPLQPGQPRLPLDEDFLDAPVPNRRGLR